MGYEITRHIGTKELEIETPLRPTVDSARGRNHMPILRAGLGMAGGLHKLADVAHIGLFRDPLTKKPVESLFKYPKITNQLFTVVDLMLVTGNSALYAVQKFRDIGVPPDQITRRC